MVFLCFSHQSHQGKKKIVLVISFEWYEAEMAATHQDVTVKRQKADASSFTQKKYLIPNLSCDLVNI